jgi:DNA-binding transcriptional ArsR family regulator
MAKKKGDDDRDERKEDCEEDCSWDAGADYVDQDTARAMAHPLRVRILAELNKRRMSPSRFARRFDEKLSNVSYHFRELQKLGCIEEVDSRPVRGAVEHIFQATKRVLFDGKAWEDLPPSLKAEVSGQTFTDFLEAVAAAMSAGTFDSSDERVAVWFQRPLDWQGWEEAVKAHWELIHKMGAIFKSAKLRLAEAGEPEGELRGTYGLFLFESPPPEPEPEEDDETL